MSALDVGEDEGDGPPGQLSHAPSALSSHTMGQENSDATCVSTIENGCAAGSRLGDSKRIPAFRVAGAPWRLGRRLHAALPDESGSRTSALSLLSPE